MNHIIDIVLVAIIALMVFISSKRGFIVTVLELASGVLAFIGARMLAPSASVVLYNTFAKQAVTDFIAEKYAQAGNSIAAVVNNLTSLLDFLPEGVLAYVNASGISDGNAVSQTILGSITTVEQIESVVVAPVITAVLQLIAFAVLSVVLLVVLRIAARFISKVITISKIADKLNSILGAVFGLLKGCVYVFIIAVALSVISFASQSVAVYTADSFICSLASTLIGI